MKRNKKLSKSEFEEVYFEVKEICELYKRQNKAVLYLLESVKESKDLYTSKRYSKIMEVFESCVSSEASILDNLDLGYIRCMDEYLQTYFPNQYEKMLEERKTGSLEAWNMLKDIVEGRK